MGFGASKTAAPPGLAGVAKFNALHIEHRLTKPKYPWTNGQVERMNRTLKEATVRRYHYVSHQQLREHLVAFRDAYIRGTRSTCPARQWGDEGNDCRCSTCFSCDSGGIVTW